MIHFADLVNAHPQALADLADRWDALGNAVEAQHARWRGQVVGGIDAGSWAGQAHRAAGESVGRTDRGFAGHAADLRRVSATLRQSAANVADARSRVDQLVRRADRLGLRVDRAGAVSVDPARLSPDLAELPTSAVAAEVLTREIAGAVSSANDADRRAAAAIDSLTPRDVPTERRRSGEVERVRADTTEVPPGAPQPGSDPAKVRKWWDGLTQAQRLAYATGSPAYVGGTDGIPCAARDYANRLVLADLLRTTPPGDKLAALRALDHTLRQSPPAPGFPATDVPAEHTGKYLLGIDTAANGHLILATNNPDAARNVTTWVPGVNTKLDPTNVRYATDIPAHLANQAGGDTSVIAWLNYDPPQWTEPAAIVDTQRAHDGAPALVGFERGLSATHAPGAPMHNVLIGHSYGSCVVGEAARAAGPGGLGGLHVNDVIAIGSPGMDVPNAAALGMPHGHVFASRAVNDPIPLATAVGPLDPHGADPTGPRFGATVFDSGWGGAETNAHGSYFNPGPGLTNLGHIIAGDPGAVTAPSLAERAAEVAETAGVQVIAFG